MMLKNIIGLKLIYIKVVDMNFYVMSSIYKYNRYSEMDILVKNVFNDLYTERILTFSCELKMCLK